jgi:hypothetical protein
VLVGVPLIEYTKTRTVAHIFCMLHTYVACRTHMLHVNHICYKLLYYYVKYVIKNDFYILILQEKNVCDAVWHIHA